MFCARHESFKTIQIITQGTGLIKISYVFKVRIPAGGIVSNTEAREGQCVGAVCIA
jgi:hypothetical protein